MKTKYVYFFGANCSQGSSKMKNLLGGKGANLAEMATLNIPVPAGFTISTDACRYYMKHKKLPTGCKNEIKTALNKLETIMNKQFGCKKNPLLISVRSGARKSMPGMMETVLNVGLTDKTITGLIKQTNNKRFSYDSYRRLITMYADVVMDKSSSKNDKNIRSELENQ